MDNFEIGIVKIDYNEDGSIASASFVPHKEMKFDERVLQQITAKPESPERVKEIADFVLGAWFSKMTFIELADPEKYSLQSEIVECLSFPKGTVKSCMLKYVFKSV